jgi:hypothetical protein
MLELNNIYFYTGKNKIENRSKPVLEIPIKKKCPAKNVYFPLGATEFFQTHPNVLE